MSHPPQSRDRDNQPRRGGSEIPPRRQGLQVHQGQLQHGVHARVGNEAKSGLPHIQEALKNGRHHQYRQGRDGVADQSGGHVGFTIGWYYRRWPGISVRRAGQQRSDQHPGQIWYNHCHRGRGMRCWTLSWVNSSDGTRRWCCLLSPCSIY